MNQTRIFKPGTRRPDTEQKPDSGHGSNGTGHHGGEPEAKPFPLHCLPDSIGAMARAIAETERTPAALAGVCTLGILSAAIGSGLHVISGPNNRPTRANLYLVASAESGSGKSETFRHAARPFMEFESETLERWKLYTLPGLAAEKDILEAEIAKLKKRAFNSAGADSAEERGEIKSQLEQKKFQLAALESTMHAPVFSVEDITTERLAVLLSFRGETLASLSPDAGGIVNNLLGRYSKLERTDEGIYLKAFSGDYCRVDRQSREPVVLKSPCLAALWLTQPDKVETLLGERSLTDGGLIPRILICHTNAEARPILEGATGIPANVREAYGQTIRGLLETYRLSPEPRTIHPSPEARALLNQNYNAICVRRYGELRDVTSFASRWGEQAWRLAVCIHAGTWGRHEHSELDTPATLELDTAERAIELADWFAGQQLAILSKGRDAKRRETRDEVLALLADNPKGITARDAQRARIARDADEAHALLATMEAEGTLQGQDEKPEAGGHVSRSFTRARK